MSYSSKQNLFDYKKVVDTVMNSWNKSEDSYLSIYHQFQLVMLSMANEISKNCKY